MFDYNDRFHGQWQGYGKDINGNDLEYGPGIVGISTNQVNRFAFTQ
jgi:hypothetical protein